MRAHVANTALGFHFPVLGVGQQAHLIDDGRPRQIAHGKDRGLAPLRHGEDLGYLRILLDGVGDKGRVHHSGRPAGL